MMNLSPIHLFAALAILAGVCISGCTGQETVISGEERTAVLAYADPIADNLLQGFNEGNYTMYSRDFSAEMKGSLDEAAFVQNRELVTSRIGLYESRGDPVVTEDGEYIAVNYPATFEREDGVNVRLVFRKGDRFAPALRALVQLPDAPELKDPRRCDFPAPFSGSCFSADPGTIGDARGATTSRFTTPARTAGSGPDERRG